MNDINQFINLELQAEVAALRAERDLLWNWIHQVDDVLTDNWVDVKKDDYRQALHDLIGFNVHIALDPAVNGGSILFSPEELAVLRRLTSGYQVSKSDQVVLDKLNIKEPDEAIDFQPVSSYGYGNNDGSTEANS